MRHIRLASIFSLLLVSSLAPQSWACSCVEYLASEPEEAFDKSDLVFAGEVVSVDVVTLPIRYFTREGGTFLPWQTMGRKGVVKFRVLKDWRGQAPKEYVILAGAPPESPLPEGRVAVDCQKHFEVGKMYLVFASGIYPEADPCAPTKDFDPDDPFIKRLDLHSSKTRSARTPPELNFEPQH